MPCLRIFWTDVRGLAASFGSEPGDGTSKRVGSYLMINIFQCCTITTGMFDRLGPTRS